MSKVNFVRLATIVFAIVGLIHLYRGFVGLPFTIGSYQAPIWVSYLESFFFLALAYIGCRNWN